MASADAMRASDGDRERVIQALQEQVGQGRLTLAEFEQRTDAVYQAKTIGELRGLISDLPIELFGRPRGGLPWSLTPMPATPPWRSQLTRRPARAHPVLLIALAVLGAFVAAHLIAALVWGLPMVIPLLIVFAVLTRGSRRRGPYR